MNRSAMRHHLLLVPVLALAACGIQSPGARRQAVVAPAPADLLDAYETAGSYELPSQQALDVDGLVNVVFLGKRIISGAEPLDEASFARLARWGVKTLLSVDGKVPDAELAEEYGMRYVHVPIEYRGIEGDELLHIAKSFRELEGPFFVHCYHGKHRGPAAAAIGRLVLDGIPREQAVAEMRQYCSTSPKYAGLYETVASAQMPDAATTLASDFDFSAAHEFDGLRATMIEMARLKDSLEAALDRGWENDAEHPDVDMLQDATQLHQAMVASDAISGGRPADYSAWMTETVEASSALLRALSDCSQDAAPEPGIAPWRERATAAFEVLENNCSACHVTYRNR